MKVHCTVVLNMTVVGIGNSSKGNLQSQMKSYLTASGIKGLLSLKLIVQFLGDIISGWDLHNASWW